MVFIGFLFIAVDDWDVVDDDVDDDDGMIPLDADFDAADCIYVFEIVGGVFCCWLIVGVVAGLIDELDAIDVFDADEDADDNVLRLLTFDTFRSTLAFLTIHGCFMTPSSDSLSFGFFLNSF